MSARRVTLDLLCAVTEDGRPLSEVLPGAVSALSPADRARSQRLAVESLRWADRSDRLLGPLLRKRPAGRAMNALRLGTWEICGDGAAPHGVVSALVDLMQADRGTRGQAGLVNAVLRRIAETGPARWPELPIPRLPKPLRRRLTLAWGKTSVEAMEVAHAAGAPLDLTPKDGDASGLAERLGGIALPTGSVRLQRTARVTALPGYDAGEWWVQDAAAAIPVRLADPQRGERALDLCAAPGGKTLQLAAAGADVTAIDLSKARLGRLEENLQRCGLTARTVIADATEWSGGSFDIVLVDAPCSATGTIRRHPDLPYAKDLHDIGWLLDLQARLIDRAVAALAPGGRLVWCTCSLLPEEGEEQLAAARLRHPELEVGGAGVLPGMDGWSDGAGGFRTRPDMWSEIGGIDGFHMARLERR